MMLVINSLGLALIFLIIWWFWIYKEKNLDVSDEQLTVIVENGVYTPARIKLLSGKPNRLHFIRKDASPCSATVIFPDLDISADLAFNKVTLIKLPAMQKGEYVFHCQMKMYNGKLIVE